jgi:hypothetical protein
MRSFSFLSSLMSRYALGVIHPFPEVNPPFHEVIRPFPEVKGPVHELGSTSTENEIYFWE